MLDILVLSVFKKSINPVKIAIVAKTWAILIDPMVAVSIRQNSIMNRPIEYKIKYKAKI